MNSSFLGFFAHAGFLRSCVAQGLRPGAVSGASAGALVAGFYAAGLSPDEIAEMVVSHDLRRAFREPGSLWRAPATIAHVRGHTGALKANRALALVKSYVGEKQIEECLSPRLAVSVTNLASARLEIVRSGPLAEFMLASGAFPGLFAARPIGDSLYWDGGLVNAIPLDAWLEDPAIHTIICHVIVNHEELAARELGRRMNIADAFNVTHQIISDELLRLRLAEAQRAGKRVVLFRSLTPRPTILNAHKLAKGCMELGEATARENREQIEALRLPPVP